MLKQIRQYRQPITRAAVILALVLAATTYFGSCNKKNERKDLSKRYGIPIEDVVKYQKQGLVGIIMPDFYYRNMPPDLVALMEETEGKPATGQRRIITGERIPSSPFIEDPSTWFDGIVYTNWVANNLNLDDMLQANLHGMTFEEAVERTKDGKSFKQALKEYSFEKSKLLPDARLTYLNFEIPDQDMSVLSTNLGDELAFAILSYTKDPQNIVEQVRQGNLTKELWDQWAEDLDPVILEKVVKTNITGYIAFCLDNGFDQESDGKWRNELKIYAPDRKACQDVGISFQNAEYGVLKQGLNSEKMIDQVKGEDFLHHMRSSSPGLRQSD